MLMLAETTAVEQAVQVEAAWAEALDASHLRWNYPSDGTRGADLNRRKDESSESVDILITAGIYPPTFEQAASWETSADCAAEVIADAVEIYRQKNLEPYADLSLAESIEVEANRFKGLGTPAAKLIAVRLAELVEEIRTLDAETVEDFDAKVEASLDYLRGEDPREVADKLLATKYRWNQVLASF